MKKIALKGPDLDPVENGEFGPAPRVELLTGRLRDTVSMLKMILRPRNAVLAVEYARKNLRLHDSEGSHSSKMVFDRRCIRGYNSSGDNLIGVFAPRTVFSDHHGSGIVGRVDGRTRGFLTAAAHGRKDGAVTKRAVLVEAVKPVVQA